jgi:hypothetical protein
MTDQSGTRAKEHIRVRVVSYPTPPGLEVKINQTLEEEYANGAEVMDIKLTSTSEASGPSSSSEYVALILLRLGRARISSQ